MRHPRFAPGREAHAPPGAVGTMAIAGREGAPDRRTDRVLDGQSSPEELRALYQESDEAGSGAPQPVQMHKISA